MPSPICLNLRALFGDKFRISHDEAADSSADPWMQTIPCRGGVTIYPHGGDVLAVEIDRPPGVAKRVAAIPGARIHQDGGWAGEMTFLFPVELFDLVAAVVKPKRLPGPRQLTEEQKQANLERLAPYGFAKAAQDQS